MAQTIIIPNGKSKAICPHCELQIHFDEIEEKFMKQEKHHIIMKCKCKKLIGIAQDMRGDFVAYEL